MEPAKIDWNRIDSRFIVDYAYEHIDAPKWVDFLAIDQQSIDDDAWFCTPDCDHPRTAQDFLEASPLSKAPRRAVTGGGSRSSPFRVLNQGGAKPKRRGQTPTQIQSKIDDGENQNPNLSIPPMDQQAKSLKAAIKSSSERKKSMVRDDISQSQIDEMQRLKSTSLSRNLFASRDILSHISEFCNELKKLATRARERETEGKMGEEKIQAQEAVVVEKERKPLFELGQEKIKKESCRSRTQEADTENMAPPLSLNIENVKHKDKGGLLQIRTNPPSPQSFSAPTKTTTPSNAPRSRLMENGILQEVKQNMDMKTDKPGSSVSSTSVITDVNVTDGRQTRALDVFWFLKPCTLSE
ncbi:RING/U-box superfamily protein isoform 1 [Hibiscus syriacus]|uniref:RING/U-box superfamily protein isoform 1 n=1 Tax=Hibiscus syriacus TaxID=106335 RepID=A0A6A3CJ25_HIBSY|nr:uncharacterized protein LOC120199426 [Hibiscus syriacus]KAE8727461.1 RING/U-box superfamily protein isoform 1 [Hibiscus syriacus]